LTNYFPSPPSGTRRFLLVPGYSYYGFFLCQFPKELYKVLSFWLSGLKVLISSTPVFRPSRFWTLRNRTIKLKWVRISCCQGLFSYFTCEASLCIRLSNFFHPGRSSRSVTIPDFRTPVFRRAGFSCFLQAGPGEADFQVVWLTRVRFIPAFLRAFLLRNRPLTSLLSLTW